MYETADDLRRLQGLLDESHRSAGEHLKRIITPERRVTAEQLARRLTGMRLLVLGTVTADGRPRVGPVDGLFYRGEFWFGSAPDSVRFRHIRRRPDVSATHLEGEPFSVTVHGRAEVVALGTPGYDGFWDYCREVYGPEWDEWGDDGAVYARVEAERMFTFAMSPGDL